MLCCYLKKRKSHSSSTSAENNTDGDGLLYSMELRNIASNPLSQNVKKLEINQEMHVTENIAGIAKAYVSNSNRKSLSTVFSSLGDIISMDAIDNIYTEPPGHDKTDISLESLEYRVSQLSQANRKYYTLTWTTPEIHKKNSVDSRSSPVSTKCHVGSHPIQRLRTLRTSETQGKQPKEVSKASKSDGCTPTHIPLALARPVNKDTRYSDDEVFSSRSHSESKQLKSYQLENLNQDSFFRNRRHFKLSSAANELSLILNGSEEQDNRPTGTPASLSTKNNDPYFPNQNTPVSAEDYSLISSCLPPYNTPAQTTGSDHVIPSTLSNKSGVRLTKEQQISYLRKLQLERDMLEVQMEQAKLRYGSHIYKSPVTRASQSVSVISHELSAPVPVLCSTIDAFAEQRHADLPYSSYPPSTSSESVTSATRYVNEFPTLEKTRVLDVGCQAKSTENFNYNQAYESSSYSSTEDCENGKDESGFIADVSSSGVIRGGYVSSAANSHAKLLSGQTSINAQVGSRDTSSHPSRVHDPACDSHRLVPYSQCTETTISSGRPALPKSSNQATSKMLSYILEAPANSPQTVITHGYDDSRSVRTEYSHPPGSLSWCRSSIQSASEKQIREPLEKYLHANPFIPGSYNLASIHEPVLSPEVYWV